MDDALDLKYLTAEQRSELFKLAESGHPRHHKVQHLRGRKTLNYEPFTFSTASITRRMLPPRIFSMSASE